MRIFLTGGRGFLGRYFRESAERAGHEVLLLERPFRLGSPDWSAIESFRPEVCVHAAWPMNSGNLNAPENDIAAQESLALWQSLADLGVRHFVGLGTCLEYAPSTEPFDEENSECRPQSAYAISKQWLQTAFSEYARERGLCFCWVRIFFVYGEDDNPAKFCPQLVTALSEGNPFEIRQPDSVRDYIHVADVAEALRFLMEHRSTGIFNIGTGVGVSMRDLARLIARVVDVPFEPQSPREVPVDSYPAVVASTRKLSEAGWKASIPLSEGIERLAASLP